MTLNPYWSKLHRPGLDVKNFLYRRRTSHNLVFCSTDKRLASPTFLRSSASCIAWYLDWRRRLCVAGRARLKRDGTRTETRFGLSEKWTSPFQSTGESVQSTAGSRGVRISGQTMDRPCSEVQCKSSGYPLQSPISPHFPPRVTVCHHVSNGLYAVTVTVP